MRFIETDLVDARLIESERHADERGYFTRLRCVEEFERAGLPAEFVQTNLSYTSQAGTFRGLHFQVPPSREGKLVRCMVGAIVDIIVDLRPDSPTFLKHEWFDLDSTSGLALFVPTGFGHGFQTRSDDVSVLYEMTDYFAPDLARGIRWNDPALAITMPAEVKRIHPRDAAYPDLDPSAFGVFEGLRR